MLIPASLKVAEGIRALVLDQFVSWKQARDGQGVKPGEKALPRKSHPDIAKQFNELDMATQHWMIGLVTLGRVTVLKALSADDKQILLEVGRGSIELDKSLQTRVGDCELSRFPSWKGLFQYET